MNLVIDLAYRGVSWRVVFVFFWFVFFFNNFVFSFFLFIWRGREIVAGCVTSYNICFSQYYGGWKSRCIVMKLEITKRTVILSSRKKVCKGSRTQFLLFVSLLQSSFPLTTELEGSLIVFFGTNTFFCFTQKIASFTVDEDKRVDIKQISIAAFWLVVCTIMQFSLSFGGESGLDSLNTLIRRKTRLD